MRPVVLDTSVVVTGLIARRGAASALVEAFFADRLHLAYTLAIFGEYAEVLARPEFAGVIDPNDRIGIILKLRASGLLVSPADVPTAAWPNVDDLPFVNAALAVESKTIITLNPRDFAPAADFDVHVLSPSEARREFL